ncbi:MAG: T9SS type A sorting domain-containing protein [Flavobacteriia bacterium]|jgi:hypothetical protein
MRVATILAILFFGNVWSQNLVPNSSFEFYSLCPDNASQLTFALGWSGPIDNNSDYYNECSINTNYSVPHQGAYNYQLAKTGFAYAGFFAYNGPGSDYREYVQTQLSTQLIGSECYYVKFFVNLSAGLMFAINNVGLTFTDQAISSTGTGFVINIEPSVLKFGNPIISDTVDWIEISGIYEALGTENFITIGNFKTDIDTDTANIDSNGYFGAYYLIDDVSVIAMSDLPNNMPANAGPEINLTSGDSVFIGQEISNLNCTWSVLGGSQIADSISGIWVSPTATTTYVVEQNLCSSITYDTVTVFVHGVGVSPLEGEKRWVTVVPNPNNGHFELDLSQFKGENVSIQILDASGRLVFENEGGTDSKLKIETNLNKGVYFMKLRTIKGVFEEKIVIQ